MHLLFAVFTASLLLIGSGHSQRVIHYRLTLFGSGDIKNGSYTNSPGDAKNTVKAIRGYVSDPTRAVLREDLYLDFFDVERKAKADEPFPPDFSIEVPIGTHKEILILLMQSGKDLTPKLMDFKKLGMSDGEQILFNTLATPIAIKYTDGDGTRWDTPILISPRSHKRIPKPKDFSVSRQVAAKSTKTNKYVIFNKGIYLRPVGGKEVMFCYMKKGGELPILETILIHDVATKP